MTSGFSMLANTRSRAPQWRCKDSVESAQVRTGLGHERCEPGNEVMGLEDQVRGAVAIRRLQRIANQTRLRQRGKLVYGSLRYVAEVCSGATARTDHAWRISCRRRARSPMQAVYDNRPRGDPVRARRSTLRMISRKRRAIREARIRDGDDDESPQVGDTLLTRKPQLSSRNRDDLVYFETKEACRRRMDGLIR